MLEQEHGGKPSGMTAEEAIKAMYFYREKLQNGIFNQYIEAFNIAIAALRLYSPSFQEAYSLNAAIADYYRNLGLPMERIEKLAAADKAGRVVILPDVSCTDADGEEALRQAMRHCNYTNNGVTRFTADAVAEKLCHEAKKVRMSVETPLGNIVAEPSGSSEYPGIWVSLHKPGEEYEPTLALVEFTMTEADVEGPALITRVWGDGKQEEYTDRVVHTGLGEDGAANEH